MIGKQKPKDKALHVLSDFVNMRFTLRNNKTYISEKTRTKKCIFEQQTQVSRPASTVSTPKKDQKSARSKSLLKLDILTSSHKKEENKEQVEEACFRLKYLQRLSEEHIIIGNQYQIDMLKIGGSIDGFLDVQHKWSINPQGVVHTISVERKFSFIALASKHQIQVYRYDLKKDHQQPKMIVNCTHDDDEIVEVRFIKNAGIYIIFKKKIEYHKIIWLCDKAELTKCLEHHIQMKKNMSVFAVPNACDNTLNVYFHQKRQQSDKFDLWMQSFVSLARVDTPQVGKMIRIYSLEEDVKDKIQIFNYNSEICLIQFQNKLIAFKNGFVIDAVSTNIHQPNYFIKYVSSRKTLFHFLDNVIDIYCLTMIEKTKPQKFKLLTRDCIEFIYKNSGKLLNILHLGQDNFAFFFQTATSRTSSDHPNITYRFAITQPVSLRDKLDKIYPSSEEMHKHTLEQLYEKSNIAQKMGLSKKDAFLQLWLRSQKISIIDFQVLLSTRHFPTIQTQIQQKLKRQSMSMRELLKIYGECETMLQQRVYSQNCRPQDLQQYTSCQFLIRKLDMLRWIQSHGTVHEGTIMVNIKDYYEYKDLSVIPAIANWVYEYIHHPKPQTLLKLRAIFKFFRLICKIEYQDILTCLVNKCKLRFLDILKVMPDLLPYQPIEQQQSTNLWRPIQEQELDQNIFLSQMITIDNRETVQQFPKSLWFKRYQYSSHGVIKEVDRKNLSSYLSERYNFQSVFYMFLCKVYHLNIFDNQLRQLITYTEQKYDLMPQHLRGKLELYLIMYSIFAEIDKSLTLYQFLKLKQHGLFKLYFQREKAEKGGFILKKIKPLYEQLLNRGKQIFNQGMFDYFSSQQSTVSDLKCILSKLNNQKNEFHINSEHLYQVLINAIMQKIKVGSNSDTPIDQILVYIENIPFPIHNECIMTNLEYIQQINFQSEMLRRIHVDMTLAQIVKNGEKVIQMMVDHEIQRHQMYRIRDYRSLRLHAYKILAEIQCRKSNIYGDKFHSYSLKIFLINIMANNDMIPLCKQLISDKYLVEQFQIDDAFKESVVMHLYQWRLSQKSESQNPYKNHLQFINLLIDLLSRSNPKRRFIEASMKYAALFTLPSYQIQYPLYPTFKYYPALVDIECLLEKLTAADLIKIQLQKIFDVMMELKRLGQAEMNANITIDGYENKLKLELYQIYLIRLVEERQLKRALNIAEIILDIPNEYAQFNIIYPILIIQRTYEEILQNTAALLSRVISFLFKNPRQLCKLLSKIYSTRLSNSQLDLLLQSQLKKRENQLAFSLDNAILRDQMKEQSEPKQRNELLQICLQRVLRRNEVYRKNHSMQIVFRLMCHEPLAMAKWIWCKGSGINMKTLRSFVSFMTLQCLFDPDATLKATIQALQVLRFKQTNNVFFSEILKFRNHLTNRAVNQTKQSAVQDKQAKAIKLISQSIQILGNKRLKAQTDQTGVFKQKAKQNWNQLLRDPKSYMMREITEYAYSDRDDAYEDMHDELSIKSKWRSKHDSNQGKISQKSGFRVYEEIPLPTARRPRKNSQYFPEMLDIQQNFECQKTLKPSQSSELLPTISYQIRTHYPVERIEEDEGESLGSMMMIKIQSNKNGQRSPKSPMSPKILQRLKQSNSICMQGFQHEQDSQSNYQFKIQVKGQGHIDAQELVSQLFNTIDGQNGVYDISLLKTQSRKNGFREYLQQVLQLVYKNKDFSHVKCMKLLNIIIDEYQWSQHLNKEAVAIFKRLQAFKGIQIVSFNFKEALPIQILFSQNLKEYYQNYYNVITTGTNSLQIFPRVKFTEDVVSKQWKQRILQSLILQKIQNVRILKEKISDVSHNQGEDKKIVEQLEMQQLKISVMVDQNESLIKRLEKKCYQLQHNKSQSKRSAGQILKMSISAIKYNM